MLLIKFGPFKAVNESPESFFAWQNILQQLPIIREDALSSFVAISSASYRIAMARAEKLLVITLATLNSSE
jgi:hypothetical protein